MIDRKPDINVRQQNIIRELLEAHGKITFSELAEKTGLNARIIRYNMNMTVLMHDNQIYGLTKGQYSPTTPKGSVTKTSPEGTIENAFKPGELTMGAQGSFFARVVDIRA